MSEKEITQAISALVGILSMNIGAVLIAVFLGMAFGAMWGVIFMAAWFVGVGGICMAASKS